ncbi:MAG: 4Fe-4S binding protein [Candidatus Aminicenantes bacterium]|jgi:ferredoxin
MEVEQISGRWIKPKRQKENLKWPFIIPAAINAAQKGKQRISLFIDEEKCTGCDICVPICPSQALSVIQNKAVIDFNKCTECLLCMDECPTNAIYQVLDDKEESMIPREEFTPEPAAPNVPRPKSPFWNDLRKQHAIEAGVLVLSGIKKLTANFLKENSFLDRRKGGKR